MILDYFVAYDPSHSKTSLANPVDERLLGNLRGWARKKFPRLGLLSKGSSHRLNDALVEVSLSGFDHQLTAGVLTFSLAQGNLNMCDLQILTGLGILLAGFISLPVLKGAHWQMVCYLAWFVTVTHLSGLSIMSEHLHGRYLERISRVVLMVVLLIVLVVAMVPMTAMTITTHTEVGLVLTWNCDATCFFNLQFMAKNLDMQSWQPFTESSSQTTVQFVTSVLAIALMCFSFVVRLGRITPKLLSTIESKRASMSTAFQRKLMKKAEKKFPQAWQNVLWRELLVRPLLCVFLLLRACLLLWSSMISEASMPVMGQIN